MTAVRRVSAILARIEDSIAGVILAAVLFVVVYELTLRSVFGQSNLWTDELSRVLLIAMTYVAAIGLTRDGSHVRVGIFVDHLAPGTRTVVERLVDVLCLIFAGTATWLGYRYVRESALFGFSFAHSDLPFPVWVAQSIVPVGFAMISLRLVLRLIGVPAQRAATSIEP